MFACAGGETTAQLLINAGAPLAAQNVDGRTPLHFSVISNMVGISASIKEAQRAGADKLELNVADKFGYTEEKLNRLKKRHGTNRMQDDEAFRTSVDAWYVYHQALLCIRAH